MPGSREVPNMVAAVEPHSLELGSQANLVVVETQQELRQLLLLSHCQLRASATLGSVDSSWSPG